MKPLDAILGTDDKHETMVLDGVLRPKLSGDQRAALLQRWEEKRLNLEDEMLLRADYERALLKKGLTPEAARQHSAAATVSVIGQFYSELARYAIQSRKDRQGGGFNSGGRVESVSRPSHDQVIRAIRRELAAGTPQREVARRVHDGGISLSTKQIRNIGQRYKLLAKGKR